MGDPESCYYFAYGSNLLQKRMHVNVPSATRSAIGKINNYRLDFARYSKRWHGCSATIVPHNGYEVWGAIWEISAEDLPSLDLQEGVHQNIYFRFNTNVKLPDGTTKECYVYEQVNKPTTHFKLCEFPADRQPSHVYKDVIVKGAEESKLPDFYQKLLQSVLCNGYKGDVDLKLVE
ncbi:hypothetical protein RI129_011302 [Pyrocoelia pectoralis]|uniref:gamma-glutamylcyclotransferase n=1 Tax=Pyrocoelia pectoralis TaxID=417401 RepID=A0AAN7ZHD6_9COLE